MGRCLRTPRRWGSPTLWNIRLSRDAAQGNAGRRDAPFEGHGKRADAPESREHKAVLSEHVGDDVVDSARSCRRDETGQQLGSDASSLPAVLDEDAEFVVTP